MSVREELATNAQTRHIPVVVVTGAAVDLGRLRGTPILRKPVTPQELVAAIRESIGRVRWRRWALGLALVPIAMSMGEAGSEIQAPMALVILCGLASSTALNMIVVPVLYAHLARPVDVKT